MKSLNTLLSALLVSVFFLQGSLEAQHFVAVRNTSLRSEPSRKGIVIEQIPKGTPLVRTGQAGEGHLYYKVMRRAGDKEGWVLQSAVVEVIEDLPSEGGEGYRFAGWVFGTGQIPPGYYSPASGTTGDSLKTALHRIIRNHKVFSYREVYSILEFTDQDPSDSLHVVLLYTGRSVSRYHKDRGSRHDYEKNRYIYQDAWNREHVWPKSFGFPDEKDTAYTDVHHIRPADRTINTERNTRSFDYGSVPFADNGGEKETGCKTSPDWIWEPPDFVKGDIARMVFYMAVRYEGRGLHEGNAGDLELVDAIVPKGSRDPFLGKLSTLLEWHEMDPVDNWERRRNDLVFRKYQGNRNPFIDHPEFAPMIWKPKN